MCLKKQTEQQQPKKNYVSSKKQPPSHLYSTDQHKAKTALGTSKNGAWAGLGLDWLVAVIGQDHLVKAGEGGADLLEGKDGMDLM